MRGCLRVAPLCLILSDPERWVEEGFGATGATNYKSMGLKDCHTLTVKDFVLML